MMSGAYWSNRRFLGFALALPVSALGVWLASLVAGGLGGTVYEVPVAGFDPRDLLSGHYLRYQVKTENGCTVSDACACFAQGRVWIEACEERSCRDFVRGRCVGNAFVAPELERYFFPEELAPRLVTVPPEATLEVQVGAGTATARQMYVNGKRIEEWAREL